MTLLHLYAEEYREKFNIANLSTVVDGTSFDDNLNSSENYFKDEYLMQDNMKKMRWENDEPLCYNVKSDEWVKFKTLHFQGGLKDKIQTLIIRSKEQDV